MKELTVLNYSNITRLYRVFLRFVRDIARLMYCSLRQESLGFRKSRKFVEILFGLPSANMRRAA